MKRNVDFLAETLLSSQVDPGRIEAGSITMHGN
jgi:hypothetical protein